MKRFLFFMIAVAIVAIGVYAVQQYRIQQQIELVENLQTEPVRSGALTATVGATGIVQSNQTAILFWETFGTVEEINVSIGDQVEKGAVLATLAQSSLPQAVIQAQAELVSAQKALDDLLYAELPKAQALQAVEAAQSALDDLYATHELQKAQAELELINAQDAEKLTSDQRDFLTQKRASLDVIEAAETIYLIADKRVNEAQKKFDKVAHKPLDDPKRAAALTRLLIAQKIRGNALSSLNWYQGEPTAQEISRAEANLELAQAQLDEVQREWDRLAAGPDPTMITFLEAQLADAKRALEQIKDGPSQDDIAVAEARIAAAQATLNLAFLLAPFNATVTDIQIKAGDRVAPEVIAFRLDDLSHLLVEVEVSEVDINLIQVGQPVILTFDAVLDKSYDGVVREVGAVGTINQGAVSFRITVEILNPDKQVHPGMTAAVNVVINQLTDALLIPNRSVRVQDGKEVIYLLKDGSIELVEVTLGASSETDSEVIEGNIKPGDLIVLNPPEETSIFTPIGGQ